MIKRNTKSLSDKIDINWEYGLLMPVDYLASLEINILIGAWKRIKKQTRHNENVIVKI